MIRTPFTARPARDAIRIALLLATLCAGVRPAHADAVFRPLAADPRESLSRWRIVTSVEDWRYGTDITDSTSRGGVVEDRERIMWEGAGGHTFRWHPWRFAPGSPVPWSVAQIGVPAAVFATFDNSGSLLNTDFQFGLALDLQWGDSDITGGTAASVPTSAPGVAARSPNARPFDRAVVTSRLTVYHRSSHLGDEYLALSRFGRNQDGHVRAEALFDHPPVKRVDLTYEAVNGIASVEWAPRKHREGVARVYAGAETKLVFPASLQIGALRPHNFRAPSFRFGAEYRAAGNGGDPHDGWVTRTVNRVVGTPWIESSWFAAADLRLAKPYNFASGDNPAGEIEAWTPRLWTEPPYGREYRRYAGSWHAMLGAVVWPSRASQAPTPVPGPEWLISLEWYRGYSFNGQFLDQQTRWRPRWYVVPSVTARF